MAEDDANLGLIHRHFQFIYLFFLCKTGVDSYIGGVF